MAGCCPPQAWPALSEIESDFRGSLETLANGATCYVVHPAKETSKAVLMIQDISSFRSGRTRGVADQFAQAGYHVLLPDMFGGNQYTGKDSSEIPAFCKQYPWDPYVKSMLLDGVIPKLHSQRISSCGIVGFCWGSLMVFHASSDVDVLETHGKGMFKAGVNCHPSLGLHPWVFGGQPECEDLVAKVQLPQLLMPSGNEADWMRMNGSVIKSLHAAEIKKYGSAKSEMAEFLDQRHGWTIRGDANDPDVAKGIKKAMELIVAYLEKML